jgi:hypothetical protein
MSFPRSIFLVCEGCGKVYDTISLYWACQESHSELGSLRGENGDLRERF